MAETLLVAGTASHVGKSTVAAGLCRYLADRDVSVAPFKAQNMSNNARATPGGEVGVSQYVQARAAGVTPSTDHNPVLLKPRGDGESQLVLDGEAVGHFEARGYYDEHWADALDAARVAHDRLSQAHDVIIAEGAGSIAEINLHDRDLANVETARFADADILLVADIERGGVFASLVGTLELVPDDIREQVAGAVITKFRGDRSLLAPGIEAFEDRTGVPVLGVLPYDDPGLPEEDSVALPPVGERSVVGADDSAPDDESVTVAVPRLPRISNFTDLQPLAREHGVRVAYVPPEAALDDADAVVLPGSKNTVDDLLALTDAGFRDRLQSFDGPVVGLCGGYQMLGEEITNADIEGTGDADHIEGLGLLPVTTAFSESKTVEHVERTLDGVGPLSGASGTVGGYEIHMGDSTLTDTAARPFDGDGAATDTVLGTYLHDLFVNDTARDAFVRNTFEAAGIDPPAEEGREGGDPYDRAAGFVAEHVDLSPLGLPDQ
ncbi:adenosylcobyric acid synthase (glutamine-hydrolysing) [Haloarcula vallismortis]|uniref:Probable cobyric acid synthase n=2 Tax=Haloarcula vallismortis TaxID=28442 RepID=M0JU73_HALVA|nr:cobyric acid synthase [Haloarcula vallismortis]EMA11494.1 cobyric acid synthase [Haloarcula vallismortis ATCC 29715]SDW42933.1 adenosylcobyric acid synthase (glutamine-hydrolysing) [Haloarcula vallismortis]